MAFDGGGCWQQHLQIVQAIVKSNGWTDGTALPAGLTALQWPPLPQARAAGPPSEHPCRSVLSSHMRPCRPYFAMRYTFLAGVNQLAGLS